MSSHSDEITGESRVSTDGQASQAQSVLSHSGRRTSNINMTSSSSSLILGLLILLSVSPAVPRPSSDLSLASALKIRSQGGSGQSWGLKVEDEDAMEETLR